MSSMSIRKGRLDHAYSEASLRLRDRLHERLLVVPGQHALEFAHELLAWVFFGSRPSAGVPTMDIRLAVVAAVDDGLRAASASSVRQGGPSWGNASILTRRSMLDKPRG